MPPIKQPAIARIRYIGEVQAEDKLYYRILEPGQIYTVRAEDAERYTRRTEDFELVEDDGSAPSDAATKDEPAKAQAEVKAPAQAEDAGKADADSDKAKDLKKS